MASLDLPDALPLQPPRKAPVGDSVFRGAMAAIAASVAVVTARDGDEAVGRTVTSMLSLSANPPTILVSIDKTSRLAELIAGTAGFSVAVLAAEQSAIADAFAGRVPHEHRFTLGQWQDWPSGHPMLMGSVAALDCEVIGAIDTGTHVLFAGAIVEAETTNSRTPLIWQRHHYRTLPGTD